MWVSNPTSRHIKYSIGRIKCQPVEHAEIASGSLESKVGDVGAQDCAIRQTFVVIPTALMQKNANIIKEKDMSGIS